MLLTFKYDFFLSYNLGICISHAWIMNIYLNEFHKICMRINDVHMESHWHCFCQCVRFAQHNNGPELWYFILGFMWLTTPTNVRTNKLARKNPCADECKKYALHSHSRSTKSSIWIFIQGLLKMDGIHHIMYIRPSSAYSVSIKSPLWQQWPTNLNENQILSMRWPANEPNFRIKKD